MPVITFKTITQISFTLDLDPTLTIGDVKKMIAAERGDDYAVELQKLIYNGKILDDAATVEDAGIDTNKFVVVMLARKKAPEPAPAPAPAVEATPAPAAAAPAAAPAPTPVIAAPPAAAAIDLTEEQIEKLNNVMAMGYTREQGLRALRIAGWDANNAVNLLLSGSDDFDAMEAVQQPVVEEGEAEEGALAFDELANLPQMEELRNIVRTNPAALPEIMREIATLNPQLMDAIRDNQQAFLAMIGGAGGAGGAGAAGGAAAAGGAGQGENVIRLSPAEAEAIQRIKSMGLNVPDALIIEAYLACDKNEELAVSYIMDAMDDQQ